MFQMASILELISKNKTLLSTQELLDHLQILRLLGSIFNFLQHLRVFVGCPYKKLW